VGASIPTPSEPDDDGGTSAELRSHLDAFARGDASGSAVLQVLADTRLFVPVVALLDAERASPFDQTRHEKQSSMASVLIESPEYGRALLAFSGIDPMRAWHEDARPVPVPAPLAARAAVGESASTLVVDVAGPTPFAVAGDELLMLAAVARAPSVDDDPVLLTAISRILSSSASVPGKSPRFTLTSTEGGHPALLEVETLLDRGLQQAIAQRLSHDPVIGRLLPHGFRLRFGDTP
jgi:hypothetical protein